jgi:hypothetical protein
MANEIYYVSKSTDNGYVVGSDANNGLSKATPFRTLDKASDTAYLTTGAITIVINDGDWIGTDIDTANSYWLWPASPGFDSCLILPENAGSVKIISGSATSTIRMNNATGWNNTKSVEWRDLILGRLVTAEGGTDGNYGIWTLGGTATPSTITATRCEFRNMIFYGINVANGALANITLNDCTHTADRITSRGIVYSPSHAAGKLTINGATINHTKWATNSGGIIYWDAGTAGVEAEVRNVTGFTSINPADVAADSLFYGIFIANCPDAIVEDCDLTFEQGASGATWSINGIRLFGNDAALTAERQKIINCTVRAFGWDATTGGGGCITVGGDGGARQANVSNNSQIIGCTAIGDAISVAHNLHGIFIVENTDCEMYGNTSKFMDIGIMAKLTTTTKVAGNICESVGLGGSSNIMYYNKGGTNDDFFNNTAVIDANSDAVAFGCAIDGATNTTGSQFNNNYIYGKANALNQIITVNTSQTATFDYNHFYITGTLPATAFTYQATSYATVALWIAARETNGVEVAQNPFNEDFTLREDAEGIGVSPNLGLSGSAVGFKGEPFAAYGLDIGGAQSIYAPFHPRQLNGPS